MPRMMRMPFCSRSLKAVASTALLGLCATQVVVGQRMSGTLLANTLGAPADPGTPGGADRHGSHGHSGTQERSAAAAVQATRSKRAVRRSEGDGDGLLVEAGHGKERSLADEGCSGDEEEGSLFVDSMITSLHNPIGGCYEVSSISNSSTSEYTFYSLGGGGPTEGQAWIYATNGIWVIGIVQETDDVTGEVSSLKTICSSVNNQAEQLSGPMDSQLDGVWICSYFEDGKTNYVAADFDGIECGCSGKSISESSDGAGYSSTAIIAIATLSALAALSLLVCLFYFHLKMRKEPTEDAGATNMTSEKENGLAPASKEEAHAI